MSILLSVYSEEPMNGYAFNLILWSYTKNWTTIMDTLCTKLQRFWHISHMWFIRNTSNNFQCKNYLKNKLQTNEKHFAPNIPYILESNPHSAFGDFLNRKKLVRGSNPHLSFNRPLPTGWLIEWYRMLPMRYNPTLRLGPMSHTDTVKRACLNKHAQSRLKPAHTLVVETWKVLIPICHVR